MKRPSAARFFRGHSRAQSPYLINVSVYILLFTITSTFLYFQQAEIARQSFADRGARTAFFARVDLRVNVLTLGAQLFLTSRLLRSVASADLGNAAGVKYFGLRHTGVNADDRGAGRLIRCCAALETSPLPVPPGKCCSPSFLAKISTKRRASSIPWFIGSATRLALGRTPAWGCWDSALSVSLLSRYRLVVWLVNGWWLGRKQEKLAKESAKVSLGTI